MRGSLHVAGVDSSTQNCKLVVVDAASGEVVRAAAVPHPDGTEVDPRLWWDALESAGASVLHDVAAISITAQQHTTLFLDEAGRSVRDAILWNDVRATESGMALRRELGVEWWADEIGLLPTGAHPVSKLRWLRDNEPDVAQRVRRVMLPHDWLTWHLLGEPEVSTTDRSDASATGYWSIPHDRYRPDIAEHAIGHSLNLPRVIDPAERAGTTRNGIVVGAGCGDNAAAALGLDARFGEVVISIGTSLTISVTWPSSVTVRQTLVDGMADAAGAYLPIVATLNGARTLIAAARMLGVDLATLDRLAADAVRDAGGLTFLPYLEGERNPMMPDATGALLGLTRSTMDPSFIARAAVLALGCAAVNGIDELERAGVCAETITLIGGGARSDALCQAIADLAGRPVERPVQREYAARGAARQALWALTGDLPNWPTEKRTTFHPSAHRGWTSEVRDRHSRWTRELFGS